MKNDKEKFKTELKNRIYKWILQLIKFLDALPKDNTTNIISAQLLRSGTSIGANYIEAQSVSSKKDFTNFFHHALKSSDESKFWLFILRDTNKGPKTEAENLLRELIEIANILASSILTLKRKK